MKKCPRKDWSFCFNPECVSATACVGFENALKNNRMKAQIFTDKNARFVNVKRIKEIKQLIRSLEDELNNFPEWHCKICGDTKPRHNYASIFSGGYPSDVISAVTCNRCYLSDEQYSNIFKEPKEIIK